MPRATDWDDYQETQDLEYYTLKAELAEERFGEADCDRT